MPMAILRLSNVRFIRRNRLFLKPMILSGRTISKPLYEYWTQEKENMRKPNFIEYTGDNKLVSFITVAVDIVVPAVLTGMMVLIAIGFVLALDT